MMIGRYRLIMELGRGGMAQVWLAHQEWLDDDEPRACVIKLPRRKAVADEGQLRQFLQEARISKRLRHTNIVTVFDAGIHEGLPYIVMDFIAGVDLQALLRASAAAEGPWSVETAVHVIRCVARALRYAHGLAEPIIHRDVSCKNVMIDGTGGVLLMDFGIATTLSSVTSQIHLKGTLSYMAPEHYLGHACAASDVFGLGVIFWELLAGRTYRQGLEGEALGQAIVSGVMEPVGRSLPPVIQRVLEGMLERDAAKRLSLLEVLEALKDYPDRSEELARMLATYFGRAGHRTGVSQAHFSASQELIETFALARASGVSIEKLRSTEKRVAGRIPVDFERETIERTARVGPPPIEDDEQEVQGSEAAVEPEAAATEQPTVRLVPGTGRSVAAGPLPTVRLDGVVGSQTEPAHGAGGHVSPIPARDIPVAVEWQPSPPREDTNPTIVRSVWETEPHPSSSNGGLDRAGRRRGRGKRRTATVVVTTTSLVSLLVAGRAWLDSLDARQEERPREVAGAQLPGPTVAESNGPSEPDAAPRTVEDAPRGTPPSTTPPGPASDRGPGEQPPGLAADPAESTPHEPEPVPEVTPADAPEPVPATAAARERKPERPVIKVELVVRRGIAVGYAEVRVGRGKIHEVPERGATTLRVPEGTHVIRFRTAATAPWQTSRQTFSAGMKYAGYIETSGLRLAAAPDEDG